MNERVDYIEIDLNAIKNVSDLHKLLKEKFGFPSFYGMNWNAFWDSITGLVEMPKTLRLIGWKRLLDTLPSDSLILKECLEELSKQYPSWSCNVEYLD
ncbi:barnase inhibitor [Paenibacillus albiflavus]|uniref:Barnase inhibitor n=1 Tax=Paenibacillus albiflavus TaxID=2545760 RepID=A0A4R4EGZ4_9BACL|nr:barstar family protein [Paenibacillus albiflavus]TCZ79374.1 barnase inhibitor [Paenibacillus albiflavus]